MRQAMGAVIRKDLRAITANKRLLIPMLAVPLVLTVFVPSIFLLVLHFVPEETGDMQRLLQLLPDSLREGSLEQLAVNTLMNYIMPVFFLVIPIMASSIMAASSFVGEKEKHTLETLLYSPLSLGQIFQAKVLASFCMSMLVSFLSFGAMLLVVEGEAFGLLGILLVPAPSWLAVLFLVSPGLTLLAVTLIVRGSAKAQTVEEAQQGAVFLVLPVLLLLVGQFTGFLLVSLWILLGLGAALLLLGVALLKRSLGRWQYERLLQ